MFNMGFEPQVRALVGQMRPDRQTLLFSATFKRNIELLAREICVDPVKITVGTIGQANADITQRVAVLRDDAAKLGWLMSNLPQLLSDAGAAAGLCAAASAASAAASGGGAGGDSGTKTAAAAASAGDSGGALLVFVSTKMGCDALADSMVRAGHSAGVIHGDKSQCVPAAAAAAAAAADAAFRRAHSPHALRFASASPPLPPHHTPQVREGGNAQALQKR
jgi:superfamily II DNA/RNA helicase